MAFNGGKLESANVAMLNARFDVYVVVKEPTEIARREGSPNSIGAYEIIEAITPAIVNLNIPGAGYLRGELVTNLFSNVLTDLGGTVYGLQYLLPRLPLAPTFDISQLAKFEILNIDSSLAAPGAVDFTTTINLPQGG